jgi:ribosomal protein S18 acetylase RimI-like enzyme
MSHGILNQPLIDFENRFKNNNYTINILYYKGIDFINRDMRKFVNVIFKNFEHTEFNDKLNHNRKNITRLLTSIDSIIIIAYEKSTNKILGYTISEITKQDTKILYHIYYLFVTPDHRMRGLGTKLLNLNKKYANKLNMKYMTLTFDTYNKRLLKFYNSNDFKFNDNLRSYQRYDMLVKIL